MGVYHTVLGAPVQLEQFVAAAGTAEPLAAEGTYALGIWLQAGQAAGANAGNVMIGSAAVDSAAHFEIELEPGDTIGLEPPQGNSFDLHDVYVDALNNDDGVRGWYWPAPNPET